MSGQDYRQAGGDEGARFRTSLVSVRGSDSKRLTYGRSCLRCKVYYVTEDPNSFTCPWCRKVEEGGMAGVESGSGDAGPVWGDGS